MGKSGKQFRGKQNHRDKARNKKRGWLNTDSQQQQRRPDQRGGDDRKAA